MPATTWHKQFRLAGPGAQNPAPASGTGPLQLSTGREVRAAGRGADYRRRRRQNRLTTCYRRSWAVNCARAR